MKITTLLFEKLSSFFSNSEETNHLQQALMDYLPNYYIFWKDVEGKYLGCNKAFAQLAGQKSTRDLTGKTDYDYWPKKESDSYVADDKLVMASMQPKLNVIEKLSLPNGEIVTLLTSKLPLYDKNNKIYGVFGISYNFTFQKEIEENLRRANFKLEQAYQETNKLYDSVIDYLPNYFIFWKDINSVYLGCNAAYATTAKVKSPADIVSKTDYDLPWTKEESDAYRADDNQVMQTRQAKLNIIEPQTLADGKKIILSTSKIPLINDKNEVYGILGIYSDITEQKLNEEKLIESNKKLEVANKVKIEFIRNISHDIRTPLGGIQQIFQALSDNKIPELEISEYACAGLDASKKLMELFDQVIDVSKKEHFDFEDKVVKFDLYKLLQDLSQTYSTIAKHKTLVLDIQYAKNVPRYLKGKHVRLHRILMNLLGNALKFTNEGSVKLMVELSQETDEQTLLRFTVVDTGIGIAEEQHEAIFEPFSRLNPSFENQYKGSGLGLHLVKDYVEKMSGEIYVKSYEGRGSTFTCIIPFKKPLLNNGDDVEETNYIDKVNSTETTLEKLAPQSNSVTISSAAHDIKKSSSHVLLVEDDMMAQRMGMVYLKDKAYQVDLAKTGEEALELTEKNSYDIIYMDIGLGAGIDGIETTRRIRKDAKNKNQKVFITAITAHGTSDETIVKQCMEAGMQYILPKPLSPEKILQIQNLLMETNTNEKKDSVIDFDLWRTRLGSAANLLEELVNTLGQEFAKYSHEIKQAYEAHDLSKLKVVTHKFKGALLYSGFPRLEKAIIAIELAAKKDDLKELDRWYSETMAALKEAQVAYQEWAKEHPKI